jgi:hypothetical protein
MSNKRASLAKKRAADRKNDMHIRSNSNATDELGSIARLLQQESNDSWSDGSDDSNERPRSQSMPLHLDAPLSSTLSDNFDISLSRVTVGETAAAKKAAAAFQFAATSAICVAQKLHDGVNPAPSEAAAKSAKNNMLQAMLGGSGETPKSSCTPKAGTIAKAMAPSASRLLEKVFQGLPGATITVGKVRAVLLAHSICRVEQLLALTSTDLSTMTEMRPSWCKRLSEYMRVQRMAQQATNTSNPVAKANDELVKALGQRRANINAELLIENKSRLRRRRGTLSRALSAPSAVGSPAMIGEGSGFSAKDIFVNALDTRRGVLAHHGNGDEEDEDEEYYSSSHYGSDSDGDGLRKDD